MRQFKHIKLTLSLGIIALIVVACGGDNNDQTNATASSDNPDTTQEVTFLATDAPTIQPSITPSPPLPAPTDIPLDEQLPDLRAGQYSLSLAGAINSDIGYTPFDTGQSGVVYTIAPGGSNDSGPYQLILWTDILTDGTTEDTTAQLILTFPPTIGAGDHSVVAKDATTDPNAVTVELVTGLYEQRFAVNANGTLTVVSNGGVGGVFSGEFEVTVGDDGGNTVLASGRASAIGFIPIESADLTLSGAIIASPSPELVLFALSWDRTTSGNNDWRLDITLANSEQNPLIIQHRIYMTPGIAPGTYDIAPRRSELDARPEDLNATAHVEIFNTSDGSQVEVTDISGTLEVATLRDFFTATFTLTYTTPDGEVTAVGGGYNLYRPATS